MKFLLPLLSLLLLWTSVCPAVSTAATGTLQVLPLELSLIHPQRPYSLLVGKRTAEGYDTDLTREAKFSSSNPAVARVDDFGWVHPVADGTATISVSAAGRAEKVEVRVQLPPKAPLPSFRQDIMPVLSKGGCNAGACHGYSLGKNGFKLSLRGADAEKDFLALTDEFSERRINRHNPPSSLLLLKALGDLPHEGGVRLEQGTEAHAQLLQWIGAGAPDDAPSLPSLVSVHIAPQKVVVGPGAREPYRVVMKAMEAEVGR
jgi:hypothetical protein